MKVLAHVFCVSCGIVGLNDQPNPCVPCARRDAADRGEVLDPPTYEETVDAFPVELEMPEHHYPSLARWWERWTA